MNRAQRRAAASATCVLCGTKMDGDRNGVAGATWYCHGRCWQEYEAHAVGRPDLQRMGLEERRQALRVGLTRRAKRLYARHQARQRSQ